MNNRFDQAAIAWDKDEQRVRMAEAIAEAMMRNLKLKPDQVLMDYGTGTGLIALKLQPYVQMVVTVDTSQGMLNALREKLAQNKIGNAVILEGSIEDENIHFPPADVIVSSMALHHIRDTAAVAKAFWMILKPGGQIAIADMDEDNGEFHSDPNAAVYNGFNRAELQRIFENAGFTVIRFQDAHTRVKRMPDGTEKSFTIFLMTAIKSSEDKGN